MGYLNPILVQEVLPGDRFRVKTDTMLRMAPMLAPIMHRLNVTVHYFFVPDRLVWNESQDFITGGPNGTTTPVVPYMEINNTDKAYYEAGQLADYMGIPTIDPTVTVANTLRFSALPFRAYQLIYDEYYRDQNVSTSLGILKTSGAVTGAEAYKLLALRKRAWEKDYFTSALPWAQRGPEVLLPIEGTGDVTYRQISNVVTQGGTPAAANTFIGTTGLITGEMAVNKSTTPASGTTGRIENIDEVTFDGASTTINDLRNSLSLQQWLEKNARGGARYIEQILGHFGVMGEDARLQRPEYLGGGQAPVIISEVLATTNAETPDTQPLGQMGGHGYSVGRANSFSKRFTEHGHIIGIMSVLPKTAYQQGLPRAYSRFNKFDYAFPEFANIGEQEIKQRELYYSPTGTNSQDTTFGYQERYAEYKYQPSTVHGAFKTNLAYWHMGRIFSAPPTLNEAFIQADPTGRIFAVDNLPNLEQLYVLLHNKVDALRPLPYHSIPGI